MPMAQSHQACHCDVHTVSILGKPSIRLGFHLPPYIAHTVFAELRSSTYVLITDSNISPRHLPALKAALEQQLPPSARLLTYILPPGEQSKCREMKAILEDWLLDHRCTRDTVILALGGGVIGDLIGFVSATFMRGIRFCQIPTTLLAMVDSSVGGKVCRFIIPQSHTSVPDPTLIIIPLTFFFFFFFLVWFGWCTDRNRYPTRQKSGGCILAAILHLHRCCLSGNVTRTRICEWDGGSGQSKQSAYIIFHHCLTLTLIQINYRQLQSGMNSNLRNSNLTSSRFAPLSYPPRLAIRQNRSPEEILPVDLPLKNCF
jgi:hypothetical protein